MTQALEIAGENISAATTNNSTNLRKTYISAAKQALNSVVPSTLPANKRGIYLMLQQKLQVLDPVSYPQIGFGDLDNFESTKSKLILVVVLVISTILLWKKCNG